jgi:hypothetical protein
MNFISETKEKPGSSKDSGVNSGSPTHGKCAQPLICFCVSGFPIPDSSSL